MSSRRMHFKASRVECSEAIDWQIVQVCFDTVDSDFDEENRTSSYLMLSADFEFNDCVQIEYHDGEDYAGDSLDGIELWRRRVLAFSAGGYEFDIVIELSDDAFIELREYLKVLSHSDCFRE